MSFRWTLTRNGEVVRSGRLRNKLMIEGVKRLLWYMSLDVDESGEVDMAGLVLDESDPHPLYCGLIAHDEMDPPAAPLSTHTMALFPWTEFADVLDGLRKELIITSPDEITVSAVAEGGFLITAPGTIAGFFMCIGSGGDVIGETAGQWLWAAALLDTPLDVIVSDQVNVLHDVIVDPVGA